MSSHNIRVCTELERDIKKIINEYSKKGLKISYNEASRKLYEKWNKKMLRDDIGL